MSILGTRVLRTEDPGFLARGAIYTDDVRLPGACHVFFAWSPVAHARIRPVDVSAALEAPGVIAAFTGADLGLPPVPPMIPGMINEAMPQPLLVSQGGDNVQRLQRWRRYIRRRLAVIDRKRDVILRLRDSAVIDDIALRRLQRRLDNEEIRLAKREPEE